jgi:hypothetical protein
MLPEASIQDPTRFRPIDGAGTLEKVVHTRELALLTHFCLTSKTMQPIDIATVYEE